MVKSDIRRIKSGFSIPGNTSIIRIASCYIEQGKTEMKYQNKMLFERIEDDEAIQYIEFFKKGITGVPGKTCFEITPFVNLLEEILDDEMSDDDRIKELFEKVKGSFKTDDNYSVFIAYGKDLLSDGVEYPYVILSVYPCPRSKPGIIFNYPKNEFSGRKIERVVGSPVISFLYPSLDDGEADRSKVCIFVKNEKEASKHNEMIENIFEAELSLSPKEQKETFEKILRAGFMGDIPYDGIKSVYEDFAEKKLDAKIDGKEAKLTAKELAEVIINCSGMDEEQSERIRNEVKEYSDTEFSLENIAPNNVSLITAQAVIKVDIDGLTDIRKEVISGISYYVIPCERASIDGIVID